MQSYIALLRGINVGGNNLLPMKELVILLERNGLKNVKTYIQSGNIVFSSHVFCATSLSELISNVIAAQFNFKPNVIVLENTTFDLALKNNPYTANSGKTIHFYFCKSKANIDIKKIEKYQSKSEDYKLKNNICYFYAPDGIGKSKLINNIEKCLGTPATGRNLNTLKKLKQLMETTESCQI